MHRRVPATLIALAALLAGSGGAGAQPAGPLAIARADLDGDGKTDEVRVGRDGVTTILFAGARRASHPTFRFILVSGIRAATVTIDQTIGKKPSVLVVGSNAARASEGLWIEIARRRATERWRGHLGLYDGDTGTTRGAGMNEGTLYRFYQNPNIARCDGKPAWLDAEAHAPKMRPAAPPTRIAPSAPTIEATVAPPAAITDPALAPHTFLRARVSSSVGVSSPDLLGDRGTASTWTENRPTSGAGEFLTAFGGAGVRVAAVRLIPGTGSAGAQSVPTRIGLTFNSGDQLWVKIPRVAPGTAVWITPPEPIASTCVTVVLDAVRPARGAAPTSITGLSIFTSLDLRPGGVEAALVERVIGGGLAARRASRQLRERPVDRVLAAVLPAVNAAETNKAGKLRLRRLLATFRREPAQIAKGISQREANRADRKELIVALMRMGDAGVEPLASVAADRRAAEAARSDCARALAASPAPTALAASIELATTLATQGGQRALRRDLSLALGARRNASVESLVTAARSAAVAAAPDLWRVVGVHAQRHVASVPSASSALAEALAGATGYELSYRLLEALGRLPHPLAIRAVADALDARRAKDSPQDVALRRIGTLALARNHDVAATAGLMLTATRDADVQVRLEAVEALAQSSADDGSDARLGDVLASDTWPAIRRAAAAALAPRCARPAARTLLRAAAKKEGDIRVGTVVLAAIVDCGGPDLINFLIRLARTRSRPTALRGEAIKQAALAARDRKDTSITPTLITMFEGFVSDSFSDEKALVLAQASARALCRVGDPRAIKPLVEAAVNSAFSEVQAAAARSLGCYCTPETAPVLRDLSASGNVGVSIAARGAAAQCKKRR